MHVPSHAHDVLRKDVRLRRRDLLLLAVDSTTTHDGVHLLGAVPVSSDSVAKLPQLSHTTCRRSRSLVDGFMKTWRREVEVEKFKETDAESAPSWFH